MVKMALPSKQKREGIHVAGGIYTQSTAKTLESSAELLLHSCIEIALCVVKRLSSRSVGGWRRQCRRRCGSVVACRSAAGLRRHRLQLCPMRPVPSLPCRAPRQPLLCCPRFQTLPPPLAGTAPGRPEMVTASEVTSMLGDRGFLFFLLDNILMQSKSYI